MERTVKITENVPIPPQSRSGVGNKYPFHLLNIGDSITTDDNAVFKKMQSAAQGYKKRHGVSLKTRKGIEVIDDEAIMTNNGGTIWRTA
jgi:hypothetical protein